MGARLFFQRYFISSSALCLAMLSTIAVGTVACGPKGSHNVAPAAAPEQTYFIQGDPLHFVENTVVDARPIFTLNTYKEFDHVTTNIVRFRNSSPIEKEIPTTQQQLEKANAPTAQVRPASSVTADWIVLGSQFNFRIRSSDTQLFDLVFTTDADGNFVWKGMAQPNHPLDPQPGQNIHNSISQDRNSASMLIFMKDADGSSTLIAFYFSKRSERPPLQDIASAAYNYLFGPGVKIGWDTQEGAQVTLCGPATLYEAQMKKSVALWQKPLEGRLRVNLKVSADCPPFSDLNTHGVYLISGYRAKSSENELGLGNTITHYNGTSGNWLDSDVFVNKAEFEKEMKRQSVSWGDPGVAEVVQETLSHELGHFLGLDHQFTTPSIMGYDKAHSRTLSDYDVKAIQTLYPVMNSDSENVELEHQDLKVHRHGGRNLTKTLPAPIQDQKTQTDDR